MEQNPHMTDKYFSQFGTISGQEQSELTHYLATEHIAALAANDATYAAVIEELFKRAGILSEPTEQCMAVAQSVCWSTESTDVN
jgi:hypothetical protein